jgi:diaminopimelate epimerase
MAFRFHKMHGLGNDFVVVDARHGAVAVDPMIVRALADRRTGIGCDQLILIGPGTRSDVTMRIWNADGSEVAACGNATRCVPVLIGRDCTIETTAGILYAALDGDGARVDMGVPRFGWEDIPLAYAMDTAALPVAWGNLAQPAAVNVGNPHLVFFVDDLDMVPLAELGPDIEHDPLFPERINVNVATIHARDHVAMRTWERGAGLTRACGTGACATFAAGRRLGRLDPAVRMDLPGGTLRLAEGDGGRLIMSGPATHVFTGEADLAAFA